MKIALIPSNQHLNKYANLSGVTEEIWAVNTTSYVGRNLISLVPNIEVQTFHIPGKGTSSIDELNMMLKQALAWKPDYVLSIHSDAVGDKKVTGVLALNPWESSRTDGAVLANLVADNIGLPYRGSWVWGVEARKINFLTALRNAQIPGCLLEIGEHATAAEAAWNWEHYQEIGLGIARALIEHLHLAPMDIQTEIAIRDRVAMVGIVHNLDIILARLDNATPEQIEKMEVKREADIVSWKVRLDPYGKIWSNA